MKRTERFLVAIMVVTMIIGTLARPGSAAGNGGPRINPELLTSRWRANWIRVPGTPPADFGVYHFRRVFELASRPDSFVIHVTGDNRYQLFVNGERVVWGPARGDIFHWRYETVDIARQLKAGRNTLAAVVVNFGQDAAQAQTTDQTGFLVQGDTKAEEIVNTDGSWKCIRDESYKPLPVTYGEIHGYYAAGPGERVQGDLYPWNWQSSEFDDSGWKQAQVIGPGAARDSSDSPTRWMLVPRTIPMMEETPQRIEKLRRSEGIQAPASFPASAAPFSVPAGTKARLLMDQTFLTTAYPELTVSGGRGAAITLRYAESLFKNEPNGQVSKGNRNDIDGKVFIGNRDEFVADGGSKRTFRPLWWRTYRYIEMTVETKDEGVTIEDLHGVYTGYPFERKARFDAGRPEIQKILDTGWRTARLCSHETYMDCPYYEQLEYAGDTRIQCMVSLFQTGDARLMRNAISALNDSRTAEGATYSRAPSRLQQYIPPFSLWWIGMVHDYWMYQDDPGYVRQMLPGVRAVLSYFAAHQKSNGSLGPMPWWNFVDWVDGWSGGVPPAARDGSSAPLDLQLLLAYDWASGMEEALGSRALAGEYRQSADQLRSTIQSLYWDPARRLYADVPDRSKYSQHSNALAIIAGLVSTEESRGLIDRTLSDKSLAQCSIYFRYYLNLAVNRAGEGDRYIDLLGEWRTMLDRGLTTWAETADPTRSDCHAWGASPNIEFFRTVLGIDTAAPGFKRVVIRPFPGSLKEASGAIPHPKGEIAVRLSRNGDGINADVMLPEGVSGDFVWKGKSVPLGPGSSHVSLP